MLEPNQFGRPGGTVDFSGRAGPLRRRAARTATRPEPPVFRVNCPAALLEVLYVRHVWELQVLPDVPPLVAPSLTASQPPAERDVDLAVERCRSVWEAHATRPAGMAELRPALTGPHDLVGLAPSPLDVRAMRSFIDQARRETLAALRASDRHSNHEVAVQFGDLLVSAGLQQREVGEVVIDVLPLAATFQQHTGDRHLCVDLASWTATQPQRSRRR